ncbi:hypothetical protein [Dechloromonas sp. H13]|uniref:hypothetical protein n=1 Tax=Dechloromonas sp. H13 TaxID=2570193 RepID=UPI001291F908|nr:hypothetical protein [Dechloromonas sp. H13]
MADCQELIALSGQYAEHGGRARIDDLRALATGYIAARRTSILDAAAIALAFDAIMSQDTFDVSEVTPEMASAWELAYPNVPIESLAGRSTEGLAGAISGWKGKLFEVEVEQRLNAGEWVGDLHLEAGQRAQIAASATQPGWDIQIIDENGAVANAIQLKATESVSYVHEALDRYPDTPILATHEVASKLADHPSIMDSGIHNDALTSSVSDHVSDASSDAVSDALIGAMPLSIIAITEGSRVLSGKKTVDQALASGGDRVAKGAMAGAVAATVSIVATPLVGAIAGFITRLALDSDSPKPRRTDYSSLPPGMDRLRASASGLNETVKGLEHHYPCPPRFEKPKGPEQLSDEEELLSLVDQPTRLAIERGSMPLDLWIDLMIKKETSSLPEAELQRHLIDLRQIQAGGMIETAFRDVGFAARMGAALAGGGKVRLKARLQDAIQIAELQLKKFAGNFTQEDADRTAFLKMTTWERAKVESEKRMADRLKKRGIT